MRASEKAQPFVPGPVWSLLDEAVRRFPNNLAIDFLGYRMTYAQLGRAVERATRGFQRLGVRKGTRVGLCLPNTPYYAVCTYAILKAGGTVVNFNPLYVERELRHQVEDSGTTIMVVLDLPDHYRKVAPLLGGTLEKIVVCPLSGVLPVVKSALYRAANWRKAVRLPTDGRQITYAELIADATPPAPVAIEPLGDLAVLQYTGGTTGVPKGAMLTHANLSIQVEQLRRWIPECRPGEERVLGVLPLFHVFALTVVMHLGIALGSELVLLPRFELKQLMRTLARKRPTWVPGVPTLYTAIANAADQGKWDLSFIRMCISGGAPLPAEVRARFEKMTGCHLVEGYGLSETSPVVTISPPDDSAKAGSVGLPIPGTEIEIRALDDPSRAMPTGERGEVCVRGPQVMAGYWNRPDETALVLKDGWLHTGDVGYRDEDGFLFLVDRVKDMIISSGFKVYPRVVEEALYRHPAVAEAVVIGVPDTYKGQVPKAFVKLREGMQATADDIRVFLESEISHLEMPREIAFRDEMPKTAVGKISKKDLIAAELGGAKSAPGAPGKAA